MLPDDGRPADPLPQRFGPFTLYDRVGRGGMAEIFLARAYTALGHPRRLAIKRIHKRLCADERFAEMFVTEARICAPLRHCNIVRVFDLGRIDDRLYIAMEYVEGLDLGALLRGCTRRSLPLPHEHALFILHEASRGLAHAHRARDEGGAPLGIVHRDLSPGNVLLSFEGEVKLCDFGIAKATFGPTGGLFGASRLTPPRTPRAPADPLDERGMLAGKFAYMSPEQARGDEVDARSDVFAFGILAWEILAGRRLYKGANEIETLRLARNGVVPPLPDRGLPGQDLLGEWIERATAPDPARRFPTADDLCDGLLDAMIAADVRPSQIRFARYLGKHFGRELTALRIERERAMALVAPARHRPPGSIAPLAGPPGGVDRRADDCASRWAS